VIGRTSDPIDRSVWHKSPQSRALELTVDSLARTAARSRAAPDPPWPAAAAAPAALHADVEPDGTGRHRCSLGESYGKEPRRSLDEDGALLRLGSAGRVRGQRAGVPAVPRSR